MPSSSNPHVSLYIHVDKESVMKLQEETSYRRYYVLDLGNKITIFLDPDGLDRLSHLLNTAQQTSADVA